MNLRTAKLLSAMDQKTWCRMLVCFGPGLVLGKLASQVGLDGLGLAATITLVLGCGTFLSWNRVRGLKNTTQSEADVGSDVVSASVMNDPAPAPSSLGGDVSRTMLDLVAACDGSSEQALALVQVELEIDPNQSYGDAVTRAQKRKAYLNGRP